MRRIALLGLLVLLAAACSSTESKQWYKPNGNYTSDEFRKDRTECTKQGEIDEDCLKARGWVSISADNNKGPAPVDLNPRTKGNRPTNY